MSLLSLPDEIITLCLEADPIADLKLSDYRIVPPNHLMTVGRHVCKRLRSIITKHPGPKRSWLYSSWKLAEESCKTRTGSAILEWMYNSGARYKLRKSDPGFVNCSEEMNVYNLFLFDLKEEWFAVYCALQDREFRGDEADFCDAIKRLYRSGELASLKQGLINTIAQMAFDNEFYLLLELLMACSTPSYTVTGPNKGYDFPETHMRLSEDGQARPGLIARFTHEQCEKFVDKFEKQLPDICWKLLQECNTRTTIQGFRRLVDVAIQKGKEWRPAIGRGKGIRPQGVLEFAAYVCTLAQFKSILTRTHVGTPTNLIRFDIEGLILDNAMSSKSFDRELMDFLLDECGRDRRSIKPHRTMMLRVGPYSLPEQIAYLKKRNAVTSMTETYTLRDPLFLENIAFVLGNYKDEDVITKVSFNLNTKQHSPHNISHALLVNGRMDLFVQVDKLHAEVGFFSLENTVDLENVIMYNWINILRSGDVEFVNRLLPEFGCRNAVTATRATQDAAPQYARAYERQLKAAIVYCKWHQ